MIKRIINKIKLVLKIKQISREKSVDIQKPYSISDINLVSFGDFVYIGPNSYIMSKGTVNIGNNVICGPRLTIWTENHNFKSTKMLPYDESDIKKPVSIGNHVWIGLGVSICPGVNIGEGAIIGMGSVVRGDIPERAIVFGNPAKIVGFRDEDIYNDILKNEGFYYKNKKNNFITRGK